MATPGTAATPYLPYTTKLANQNLDAVLPGGGRTTPDILTYLANNAVFNVKDFGAKGDGTTDDTTAIQNVINAAATGAGAAYFPTPSVNYKTTAPLTITADYTTLYGDASPGVGPDANGPIIRYTGTGTAIIVGKSPGVNGSYIYGTTIKNLRISVDDNSAGALQVWHSVHGRYSDLGLFGCKGTTNKVLRVQAGVDNIYERIDSSGTGQTAGAGYAEYAIPLSAELGFGNETATTTVFRSCYFHYGYRAAKVAYDYKFRDCIFEASGYGVELTTDSIATFDECHFEANLVDDFLFSNGKVYVTGGVINAVARQYFIEGSGSAKVANFTNVRFQTSHGTPKLFEAGPGVMAAGGKALLRGCTYPTAMTMGGGTYASTDYVHIGIPEMWKATYRFKQTGVTGSIAGHSVNTDSGLVTFTAPAAGHVVGFNVYSDGALTGGTITPIVLLNGSNVAQLAPGATSTQQVATAVPHFEVPVAAGDTIGTNFSTNGLTSTTGIYLEVIVAYGIDGVGL